MSAAPCEMAEPVDRISYYLGRHHLVLQEAKIPWVWKGECRMR